MKKRVVGVLSLALMLSAHVPSRVPVAVAQGAGVIDRASVASNGAQSNDFSFRPSISADGRYVAFGSQATNLVSGDTNSVWDIFVRDRQASQTLRVSVSFSGAQANERSFDPQISGDGHYITFTSIASNLAAGDTNNHWDIFVRDVPSGATTRVSVANDESQSNERSEKPSISADGRYIAFESAATNLVAEDFNFRRDIFVRDRLSGTTERISVTSDGAEANDHSQAPAISADGRYVAFESSATNLVEGDTNGFRDIFIHDRQAGTTARVSAADNEAQANSQSLVAAISGDGRSVAFESLATNLVAGGTIQSRNHVFVRDWQQGRTELVSLSSGGIDADDWSRAPSLSTDGRYVAFGSNADNLVAGDTNFSNDIFVRDRQASQTTRVNLNAGGAQAEGGQSTAPFISADGRYVTFESAAANLVSGDTNFKTDIFIRDISALGSGSLRAFFNIDARRNQQGHFVYPWAQAGNATLPIKLNQASAQTVTVNARIEGAGGTVTRALIFAPGQTTQNLLIDNPQPGANQQVNIALQIAGTAIAQGEQAGSEVALFFIPPESGRDLCYACAIWFLLSILGAEDPFLTALCTNTSNIAAPTAFGDTISTLRAVRDQILADTPTGRYYTALYYGHSPELSRIAATNPTILWESWETLEAWTPALQSLVAGQGKEATITQAMVNDLNSVLEQIEAAASPQLRLVIQREQNALNLPSFVGRTMDAAWEQVKQRQVSEVFLPLTSKGERRHDVMPSSPPATPWPAYARGV